MKSSNRWLYYFGAAIGLLVIVTIVLALTIGSPSQENLLSADTPEGTVQHFLLAVKDGDYQAAESYLAPPEDPNVRPELDLLKNRVTSAGEEPGWRASLGDTNVTGEEATVDVTVDVFRPRGPFENSVDTYQITFFLTSASGDWKITSPLNIWWLY